MNLKKVETLSKSWEEIEKEIEEFKQWCTDFRQTVDQSSATYEEKLRACERFNVKVKVYKRDPKTQKPRFEIEAKPIIVLHSV